MNCESCGSIVKFKDRYVLYTGYPLRTPDGKFAGMTDWNTQGVVSVPIICSPELSMLTPKYRLVLERVK